MGSRLVALAVAAAAACALAASSSAARADLGAYQGLGTWVDIFGKSWADPEAAVAAMGSRGVSTLFLETSNYSQPVDVVRPALTARFIEAAHAEGLQVVAWYLPSLASPARDLRRSLAAIRFTTPDGQGFDSFALDIEASVVRKVSLRNARLLALGRGLRAAAGPDYALGAIIPSPVGMQLHPHYWPGFPYAQVARTFDVFLPMDYYTHRVHGAAAVYSYTARGMAIIRSWTGVPDVPINVIGGLAGGTTAAEARSFVAALGDCGAAGGGLYDFEETTANQWSTLAALETPTAAVSACPD